MQRDSYKRDIRYTKIFQYTFKGTFTKGTRKGTFTKGTCKGTFTKEHVKESVKGHLLKGQLKGPFTILDCGVRLTVNHENNTC